MKRFIIVAIISITGFHLSAQDSTGKKSSKQQRREERQQRINALVRQQEEGALVFSLGQTDTEYFTSWVRQKRAARPIFILPSLLK